MYVNYCHQCGETLSSARDPRCPKCEWLICACGACGCSYHVAAAHAALAGVARVWAPVARPARVGLDWRRVPAPAWLLGAAGLLVAALLLRNALMAADQPPVAQDTPAPVIAVVPTSPAVVAPTLEPAPASAAAEAPVAAATAEPAAIEASAAPGSAVARAEPPAPRAPTAIPTFRPTPPARPTIPPDPALARLAIGPVPPTFGPTARATPAPASGDTVLYVANTDGLGAYLRSHPRDTNDTRLVAWREGTPMIPLETQTVNGPNGPEVWVRVRDPNGQSGWIKQAYLAQRR